MLLIYENVCYGLLLRKDNKLFIFQEQTIPKVAVIIKTSGPRGISPSLFTIGVPPDVRVFDRAKIEQLTTWQDVAAALDTPLEEVKSTLREGWKTYAKSLDAVEEFLADL